MDIGKFLQLVFGKRVDAGMSIMVNQPAYMKKLGIILSNLDQQYVVTIAVHYFWKVVFLYGTLIIYYEAQKCI